MDEVQVRFLAITSGQPFMQRAAQMIVGIPGGGVNVHAGWFVEGNQVVVFKQDAAGIKHYSLGVFGRRPANTNYGAGLRNQVARAAANAVNPDRALAYERSGYGAKRFFQNFQECAPIARYHEVRFALLYWLQRHMWAAAMV